MLWELTLTTILIQPPAGLLAAPGAADAISDLIANLCECYQNFTLFVTVSKILVTSIFIIATQPIENAVFDFLLLL